MIRGCIFGKKIYGYNVTGWERKPCELDYDNLLTEDLIERIEMGDIIIYFLDQESFEDWAIENNYKYEMVFDEEEG